MYLSIPHQPRKLRATEARLERIYKAAYAGLKGDSLAIASGMLPVEYRQLCELDPAAMNAALQGRADAELEHATMLAKASREGDAKASLAILQHQHGWTSKADENASRIQVIVCRDGVTVQGATYEGDTYMNTITEEAAA